MKNAFLISLILILFTTTPSAGVTAQPRVVTSIAPIHSLASAIMFGAEEPKLLLRSGGSPHSSSLRPSDLAAIEHADLIVWVGPEMEQFLTKALRAARSENVILTLMQTPGLTRHPVREGGVWEDDPHHNHEERTADPHIWLNPQNAILIADAIRDQLIALDPHRAELYRRNGDALTKRLHTLDGQLRQQLNSIQSAPYIVFHDAYQTFEQHYKLSPAGAVTIDPERRPGVRRLRQIRNYLLQSEVVCLFSEPQFEPRYIDPLTEGTDIRTGILDPLGSSLTPGPEFYFELMQQLAESLLSCLGPATSPSEP